jgi:Mrp family chromosome partitioning ATPase/capsular polysaccharide biosynthesis protein
MFEPSSGDAERDNGRVSLVDIGRFLHRWRRTIIWVTAIFVLVATGYAFLAQPLFTAVAQVMLEPSQARDTLDEVNRPVIAVDQARVESHIEIIKSDQLALDVIRKLNLTKLPEFSAPAGEQDRDGYAVQVFARDLTVRRVGQSLVIEVSFRFPDPTQAASITNALLDAYIAREMSVKADAVRLAESWLYDKQASFESQTQSVMAELKKYEDAPANTPGRAAKIDELRDRSQIYQRMHDAYVQKFNEAIQKVAFPEPDARVISPATVPLRKSYPKRALILGLAGMLGLGFGVMIALIRQNIDRSVRTASQLIGTADCLGTVSTFPSGPRFAAAGAKRNNGRGRALRKKGPACDPALQFVADHPDSSIAHEFRNIKVVLDCSIDSRKSPLIGVVAATERAGATTVAANLATVYAMCGQRTLLVDLCKENPRLTREFFGPFDEASPGPALIEVFKSAQAADRQGACAGLSVMRTGQALCIEPGEDRSDGVQALGDLNTLRQSYSAIVFDLPGLARFADARAIARYLDAMIIVVEAGSTSIDAVHSAVEILHTARAPLIGVVLNRSKLA